MPAAADAPVPGRLGLPLPERLAAPALALTLAVECVIGVAAVRCTDGDKGDGALADAAGSSEEKDGLSWGAGEGAIAMAVLMVMKF